MLKLDDEEELKNYRVVMRANNGQLAIIYLKTDGDLREAINIAVEYLSNPDDWQVEKAEFAGKDVDGDKWVKV